MVDNEPIYTDKSDWSVLYPPYKIPYKCDSSLGVFSAVQEVVGSNSKREQLEKQVPIKHIKIDSIFIFDGIYG